MNTPGVVTSLVTPFFSPADGAGGTSPLVDEAAWRRSIAVQRDSGIPAVAVVGWIGEGPTLSRKERQRLVSLAAEVAGPMRVYADVSSNDTARAETYAADAEAAGTDAVIVVTPSYSRPNVAGVRRHVERITMAVDLPVFVEFDEARTRCSLGARDIAKLVRIDGVAGRIDHAAVLAAGGDTGQAPGAAQMLAANEASCLASCFSGADGLFSAIANLAPLEVLALREACRDGNIRRAHVLHAWLMPLIAAVEAHGVAALKYALLLRRGLGSTLRLPLVPLDRSAEIEVETALFRMITAELEETMPNAHSALLGKASRAQREHRISRSSGR